MNWTVLTLGRFSRNRYWGEDDATSRREPLCTSTLIRAGEHNILVDPAMSGPEMSTALYGATGLLPEQIDMVYITHCHSDHYVGLTDFPNAAWFCAPRELDAIRATFDGRPGIAQKIQPAPDALAPGVTLIALPGHTLGLAGLVFESRDGTVVVAGDAVMTRDFFDDRRGYYNSVDFALSSRSIDEIAKIADIVVPGHGNYFLVKSVGRQENGL